MGGYGHTVGLTFRTADVADAAGVLVLLRELSASAAALDEDTIAERLRDDRVRVVLSFLDDQLVGMATLTMLVTLPDGLVGRVEDVVVCEPARGQGAGRNLMLALQDEARQLGVGYLELTSRPTREAANALYQSLGYEHRETNVYRLRLNAK